jgi:hypothetical protein
MDPQPRPLRAGSLLLLVLSASLLAAPPSIAPATLPANLSKSVTDLADEFRDRLHKSRYMESPNVSDIHLPTWPGFPTQRYTYSVTDKDGTTKTADVVMLNPSAEQIARWIVFALIEVNGTYSPDDGRKIFRHILSQSGGQFPVAGVVYEDILPADGKYELYCFRDGVTVSLEGVPHRSTTPLTPEQIQLSLTAPITRVFTYARIQSTSPAQFIAIGGPPDILKDGRPTLRWPDAIRAAYQSAWNSPRNDLLLAWVNANMKKEIPAAAKS